MAFFHLFFLSFSPPIFIGFRQIDSKMCFGHRTCRLADEFVGYRAYTDTGRWHVASDTRRRCFESRSVAHPHNCSSAMVSTCIRIAFYFFSSFLHCFRFYFHFHFYLYFVFIRIMLKSKAYNTIVAYYIYH